MIECVAGDLLPAGWNSPNPIAETQEPGLLWARELRSPVLSVPSSLIPAERNFVINPGHADFGQITFLPPVPFHFDPRLKDR
ncbi:MAG TPA: RES family NAD+ phosphorylase [Bryobacteraceae bacterium]|jgi:RES domain-containing protein|nr:RES family NAD+ phosphorylase [Bryobacteraceae bacterium]